VAERRTDGWAISIENPFRPGSTVSILLRQAGSAGVEIYDLRG
jgi:hypothetical protein